jgi:non-ribosomal peptide synthetase component E (peptide arylation enzyme)
MEKIAKENPESIAIKHKENEISYGTLNSEADLLANCLLEIETFKDKNSH